MRKSAFTLIELLVVLTIIAVVSVLAIPAISSLNGASNVNAAAYQVQGIIETARSYATANNTYVWVGFFEEAATAPETQGVGRVVVSVVASADGTTVYSLPLSTTTVTSLNPANLFQVVKLVKIDNMHLADFAAGTGTGSTFDTRPAVGASAQIGNVSSASAPTAPATVFQYPVGGSVTAQYTFAQSIQFSPRGEARVDNSSNPIVPFVEIGMQPTHGTLIDTANPNVAAIQVTGIAGNVNIYRR